ncbi:hypothetical protein OA409_02625 [Prochlorococcus sp. AH-716-M06]|nr:hypothetical protein [Prochlorococcus sp. AH-716-M06]
MKKIFISALILVSSIFPKYLISQEINIGSAFPGRRLGGGTRGECSARKIMHLVPDNNILFHNSDGQIALIIGPSNSPKDVKIAFKPYSSPDGNFNGPSPEIDELFISNSSEKIILLNIPKKKFPFTWESAFECSDDNEESFDGFGFNFIQDNSPPAISLIAPASLQGKNNSEDKISWLSKYCGKKVSQNELNKKFKINELFDENWSEEISVDCKSFEKV